MREKGLVQSRVQYIVVFIVNVMYEYIDGDNYYYNV